MRRYDKDNLLHDDPHSEPLSDTRYVHPAEGEDMRSTYVKNKDGDWVFTDYEPPGPAGWDWFRKPKMNEAIETQQQKDIHMDEMMGKRSELGQLLEDKFSEKKKGFSTNAKDANGLAKARTGAIPAVAIFALGAAMQDGANKYGAFNYRESEIKASIFHEAKMRHSLDWYEGEDFASDSLVNHLAHEMACCAILLDAIALGNFIDDRPRVRTPSASRQTEVWKEKA